MLNPWTIGQNILPDTASFLKNKMGPSNAIIQLFRLFFMALRQRAEEHLSDIVTKTRIYWISLFYTIHQYSKISVLWNSKNKNRNLMIFLWIFPIVYKKYTNIPSTLLYVILEI